MTLLLNSQNVVDYLESLSLCNREERNQVQIKALAGKNFNLLLKFPDGRQILVKQERRDRDGKTAGEFLSEWRVQEFLQQFPELAYLRPWLPAVLHFDAENSVIVFNYLDDCRDLADFYVKENYFPEAIASAIGTRLAAVHRDTFNLQKYRDFFSENPDNSLTDRVPKLSQGLERIGPEIFGLVPADGLKFFALYQRYDSLGQAISELENAVIPCCLTHNDLKLNNILLHDNWKESSESIVRIIDWERSSWGDPAFDLGTLVASYIQIWLNSLAIGKALTVEESLRLAATPLEQIQPSIAALTQAYFHAFPNIIQHRPDFLLRAVQFAGLALIQQIQAMIQYQKSFGNAGICTLQVAKSLLSRPEPSIPTVFGMAAAELTRLVRSAA